MEFQLKNVKGTKDFLPEEQKGRNEIIQVLQENFQIYGYQPLETPILCYQEILASKYAGGAEILKEMYKLKDQGDRDLALRYDLTVPFSKVIGMNPNRRMPFKRYEIGKVFRDGPVKTGRMREFIQCDVDMVGVKSVMAEAELMLMATEVFDKLGLDIYITYSNRKLLSGILEYLQISKDNTNEVILSLDKLEKIGAAGVKAELTERGMPQQIIENIMVLLDNPEAKLIDYYKKITSNSQMEEGVEQIEALNDYLDAMNIRDKVRFNPFLARGLEIYTGTVYEIFLTDGSITSSLGAGGRYDDIIGGFLQDGLEYPAVGITFGLEGIYAALTMKEEYKEKPNIDIYIIPLGVEKEALKMVTTLRREGIKADIDMTKRKLKKSLDYANKEKIPYVIILGAEEVQSQIVKIKNMETGQEETTKITEVFQKFK